MCKTKNVLIEIIESPENKRTYVLREFGAPNQAPITLAVCTNSDEIAEFFDYFKIN